MYPNKLDKFTFYLRDFDVCFLCSIRRLASTSTAALDGAHRQILARLPLSWKHQKYINTCIKH